VNTVMRKAPSKSLAVIAKKQMISLFFTDVKNMVAVTKKEFVHTDILFGAYIEVLPPVVTLLTRKNSK